MRTDKHLDDIRSLTEAEKEIVTYPPTEEAEQWAANIVWDRAREIRQAKQKLAGEVIALTDDEERAYRERRKRPYTKRHG